MTLKYVLPLKLAGVGCVLVGWMVASSSIEAVVPVTVIAIVIGLALLSAAGCCSKCPYCGQYLSYKRHWIGKFCPHCGKKIEDDPRPGDGPQRPAAAASPQLRRRSRPPRADCESDTSWETRASMVC